MNYKIIQKDAFNVIGKKIIVSSKAEEHQNTIPEFWQLSHEDGTIEKLCSIDNSQNLLGICMDFDPIKEQFSYLIAIEHVTKNEISGWERREIPAATWAIFNSVGPMPNAIQDTWERIFKEWLPNSGYKHANAPEIEVYPPGNPSAPDYQCELWIPIMKK